jgi:hypothetical protein
MIGEPIGAALNRDIATGEKVEHELDAFIRKGDKERRRTEGERPEEETWKESVRRYEAARDAHLPQEWCRVPNSPGRPSQGPLEALVAHHEAEAEKYLPKFQSPDTRVGVRNNRSIQKGA